MSAVIRIWPIAGVQDYDSILLEDFDQSLAFVRDISRLGENEPASVRLLDNVHFRLGSALQQRLLRRLVKCHDGGLHLGFKVGKRGNEMTFIIAYLQDFAHTYHFLGESFETFVPWSKVKNVMDATMDRIHKEHSGSLSVFLLLHEL